MQVACRSRLPRARSYRIVVLGSACEAASCTSRSGTPASSAAVMNACRSVWGVTALAIPAWRATRRAIRPAPCRSSHFPGSGDEDRPVAPVADREIDRPGGPEGERDHGLLAALAGDRQGAVAALGAQRRDVGAGSLGDPQPVEGEQGDQGMLRRRAEPGGDQERADLVAVQPGRMGLVVDPGGGGRGRLASGRAGLPPRRTCTGPRRWTAGGQPVTASTWVPSTAP
jgi:hypothetical protein